MENAVSAGILMQRAAAILGRRICATDCGANGDDVARVLEVLLAIMEIAGEVSG
jgi:hypothetical protein